MKTNKDNFEKIKKEAEKFYKSVNNVRCPYFNEKINFNSKGLDHIKFNGWNRGRLICDQYTRLKLIRLAPEVIRKSHTIQGFSETKIFERKKINSRWEKILSNVCFYEFVAIIDDKRIRIIVKQIEGGEKFFWSIIPFWKKDNNHRRKMCYGKDLENE